MGDEVEYTYVKGKGWVPIPGHNYRDFEYNGSWWRVTAVDHVPNGVRSWQSGQDLIRLIDRGEFNQMYSFWDAEPGCDFGKRSQYPNLLLFRFDRLT